MKRGKEQSLGCADHVCRRLGCSAIFRNQREEKAGVWIGLDRHFNPASPTKVFLLLPSRFLCRAACAWRSAPPNQSCAAFRASLGKSRESFAVARDGNLFAV